MGTGAIASNSYWVFTRGHVHYWACSIQHLSALLENCTALRTGQHTASDTKYCQIDSWILMATTWHFLTWETRGTSVLCSDGCIISFAPFPSSWGGGAPVALLGRWEPSIPSPRAVEIPKPSWLISSWGNSEASLALKWPLCLASSLPGPPRPPPSLVSALLPP